MTISVRGLVKTYGSLRAVDDLSFTVGEGEIFALLGPNGAGKTTTVEILEGYRRRDAGDVGVLGLDPERHGRRLRRRIGLMLQEGGIHPGIRVGEAVRLFASYYRDPLDPAELIRSVGLDEHAGDKAGRLSSGERQRLSLALALVGGPRVVFLDEPTSGMDPHARAATWSIVRNLASGGVTVLLTTHLLDEAEQLADRVAIIDRGRLVAIGTPSELTRRREALEFRTGRAIEGASLAAALGCGRILELGPNSYSVPAPPSPALIARLAAWLAEREVLLVELSTGRQSLEAVFLSLTADREADP